jgi:hypothetical protein
MRHLFMNQSLSIFNVKLKTKFCLRFFKIIFSWLIVYCFTSRWRIFHLHGDVTIADEGLQNLGLCSVFRAFGQGGSFISYHTCCDMGPRFFRSRPKDRSIQSLLTTHKRMSRIYSNPDSHASPFSRLLRHTRGCGGTILIWILTGYLQLTWSSKANHNNNEIIAIHFNYKVFLKLDLTNNEKI